MHIGYVSDFDQKGSGYRSLSIPICDGLTKKGHEVICVGLGYDGKEHPYEFSIIPARTMMDAIGIIRNLRTVWKFDVLIVALDIPIQETLMKNMPTKDFKYVGIMPIEAEPLCLSWAMVLLQMDKAFIISEFGTKEAQRVGVTHAEYLPLGINTEQWKPVDAEDKQKVRQALGIEPDEFMILQVADNQERKLLSKAFEAVKILKDRGSRKVKYFLVTREFAQVGWKLRDLAQFFGINAEVTVMERGMPFEELKMLYAAADCFVLTSKAEGLGLPLMEAMAMGIPCIATDCTGMKELLSDNRGILVEEENKIIDPFGNGYRYHINSDFLAANLEWLMVNQFDIRPAREYVEKRDWAITVDNLERALKKIAEDENEQEKPKETELIK